jgi:3-isopropylmalate dehydratase small subunit
MPNFAKLFQVNPMNQVLLTIDTEDKNVHKVTQFTKVGDQSVMIEVELSEEDNANTAFDEYEMGDAIDFWENMVKIITTEGYDSPPDKIFQE